MMDKLIALSAIMEMPWHEVLETIIDERLNDLNDSITDAFEETHEVGMIPQ